MQTEKQSRIIRILVILISILAVAVVALIVAVFLKRRADERKAEEARQQVVEERRAAIRDEIAYDMYELMEYAYSLRKNLLYVCVADEESVRQQRLEIAVEDTYQVQERIMILEDYARFEEEGSLYRELMADNPHIDPLREDASGITAGGARFLDALEEGVSSAELYALFREELSEPIQLLTQETEEMIAAFTADTSFAGSDKEKALTALIGMQKCSAYLLEAICEESGRRDALILEAIGQVNRILESAADLSAHDDPEIAAMAEELSREAQAFKPLLVNVQIASDKNATLQELYDYFEIDLLAPLIRIREDAMDIVERLRP